MPGCSRGHRPVLQGDPGAGPGVLPAEAEGGRLLGGVSDPWCSRGSVLCGHYTRGPDRKSPAPGARGPRPYVHLAPPWRGLLRVRCASGLAASSVASDHVGPLGFGLLPTSLAASCRGSRPQGPGGAGPWLGRRALWLLRFVEATRMFLKVTTAPRLEGAAVLSPAVSGPGS